MLRFNFLGSNGFILPPDSKCFILVSILQAASNLIFIHTINSIKSHGFSNILALVPRPGKLILRSVIRIRSSYWSRDSYFKQFIHSLIKSLDSLLDFVIRESTLKFNFPINGATLLLDFLINQLNQFTVLLEQSIALNNLLVKALHFITQCFHYFHLHFNFKYLNARILDYYATHAPRFKFTHFIQKLEFILPNFIRIILKKLALDGN